MISDDVIRQALDEASRYSATKATSAVKATAEAQPELFAFVQELTEDLSENATSLGLMMLVTILRAFELGSAQPPKEVDRKAMTRAMRKNEAMLDGLIGAPEATLREAANPKGFRQPHLMRLVVAMVMEDEDRFTPEEAGTLFLVFKTVVDALDTATKPLRKPRLTLVKEGRLAP